MAKSTDSVLETLKQAFIEFDVNKNGTICKQELKAVMDMAGMAATDRDIQVKELYVGLCVGMCMDVCMHGSMKSCRPMYMGVCMCVCMYVCMVCMYVCMCMCVCVCVCVC